jgi:ATP-dependent Lon protease
VIIPKANKDELEEISKEIRREMDFVLADTLDQVFKTALLPRRKRKSTTRGGRSATVAKRKGKSS